MGMFDSVMVPCPHCGEYQECQSKSGPCALEVYKLKDAPRDILQGVNSLAPHDCGDCGALFTVGEVWDGRFADDAVEQMRLPLPVPWRSASCEGEACSICGNPASAKVGEEIAHDDPAPARHNLTAYVCDRHFREIMGTMAMRGTLS